ncbi:DUF3080 family protein [Billgrantia sulfidoxydans]|uniref:DUF3080 family protein n=2 Tax=Billgrantia sulfidoxydans TaxID=2733484 RepID=A0ABX7W5Z1_9GAMM|nr:DUF3080 family protein [Halomonas sulfidoxydans]
MASWISLGIEAKRYLAPLMLVLSLVGCRSEEEAETRLVRYQQALAEGLGQPAPQASAPPNIGAFPDRNERLHEIPETREGILEVYALRECRITSLVAARNNQLGRVAPPSQQWIYELELWRRLHACWQSSVPETLAEADRERLGRLTRTKTEQLPMVSWNSLFDSEEWVRNFSRASSPLAPDDTHGIEAQFEALTWLHQATLNQFNPTWRHESSTLEHHLKSLRSRPLTAELLRALLLAEQRLAEATAMLADTLTADDTCSRLSATPDELGRRQAARQALDWLERLEALATRWLTMLDNLIESHIPPPETVSAYRERWLSLENPDAPLPALRQARREHRQHWHALVERCS